MPYRWIHFHAERAAYLCRYISRGIVTVHGKSGRECGKHINAA
nr:MAG TPA: hypothetical protein [Caudoviricetes sp.]